MLIFSTFWWRMKGHLPEICSPVKWKTHDLQITFHDFFRETMGFPHLCSFTPGCYVFRKMLKALALDAKYRNPYLELHPGQSLKPVATDFLSPGIWDWIQVQTNIFGFCCSYSSSLICPYSWLKCVESSCSHVHIDYWQQFWCLYLYINLEITCIKVDFGKCKCKST